MKSLAVLLLFGIQLPLLGAWPPRGGRPLDLCPERLVLIQSLEAVREILTLEREANRLDVLGGGEQARDLRARANEGKRNWKTLQFEVTFRHCLPPSKQACIPITPI